VCGRWNRSVSGRLPSIPRLGARKPPDRDTLRCVRNNVPLMPADDRVRPRALPTLPYSPARCSPATEGASIARPPRIERQGDAAAGEPDPSRVVAQSAVPRVRPSHHTGCQLVRVVQMAGESRVGRRHERTRESLRRIEHFTAPVLGDPHYERWRQLTDEFNHFGNSSDEESGLIRSGDFTGCENERADSRVHECRHLVRSLSNCLVFRQYDPSVPPSLRQPFRI